MYHAETMEELNAVPENVDNCSLEVSCSGNPGQFCECLNEEEQRRPVLADIRSLGI